MPRQPRLNAQYLGWLQEMMDEERDKESRRYLVYKKALNSLKSATKQFATPGELLEVDYIGQVIVSKLQKRYDQENLDIGWPSSQSGAAAAAAPKKPRGRPPKRSATEVDMDPPPVAKRRTVSAAELPPPVTQPAPPILQRSATMPANENRPFQFWYLDGRKPVLSREGAEVSWCEDGSQLLRMKIGYPMSQADHPLTAQLFGRERRRDNTFVAEMREDTADPFPQCTAYPDPSPPKTSNLAALLAAEKLANKRPNHSLDPSRQLPQYMQKQMDPVASGSRKSSNAVASGSSNNATSAVPSSKPDNDMRRAAATRSYSSLSQGSRASSPPGSQPPASASASASIRPPRPAVIRAATMVATSSSAVAPNLHRTASAPEPTPVLHTRPRLSHAVPHLPAVEHPSLYRPLTTFPEFDPRVFKAGTYTVKLVLDHREQGKNDREAIAKALRARGVDVVRRALEIGDVAWIACSKEDGAECALDVVLERKRLDDLVASIINKDNRFHEQKFRLHQSAMSRVLYLVEEYDTQRQKEQWALQISTALSSTQVVDGFLVKETKNLNDTIAYLTTWTNELIRSHANKDLFVIPTYMIRRHSYVDLQKFLRANHPNECYVTSFQDFQALNHKSAYTTVRDTWARMLLSVKGMSAEKVGAVIERWDTPRALWEAFCAAQEAEAEALEREAAAAGPSKGKGRKKKSEVPEARLMLQGVGSAEGGSRAIGQALSTKLYELFMSENYGEEE
ncbi:ERCC4 domain-containing protein [Mycena galopus ATCC 62051]|nr:ERCC4 domain-containing protein [Mycena galopus ATCC 62051]